MTSREKLQKALDHQAGPIPLDLGGTGVTGIHVMAIRNLRLHYGLENVQTLMRCGETPDAGFH
ncbi:MAG: hypothetical protein P1P82_03545 [Bacteroidales bacterium]|nr:hypothetical protein [Bacteroidales bacterium]MDT8431963.1 hypothetical protein [Bacteroidales bacterium]